MDKEIKGLLELKKGLSELSINCNEVDCNSCPFQDKKRYEDCEVHNLEIKAKELSEKIELCVECGSVIKND